MALLPFSGKSGVSSTRTISTTAPLSGGGDLSANRTITTSMSTNKLIGRGSAGTGVMEEITLGSNLSMSGTTLNATEAATPAGLDTYIQYNDGGNLGADSNLIWNKTTKIFDTKGTLSLSFAGTRTIQSSDGSAYALNINGSDNTGANNGGSINIYAGNTDTGAAGAVSLYGGSSVGNYADIVVEGGAGSGAGGSVFIEGGSASGAGSVAGGSVNLNLGAGVNGGANGKVNITPNGSNKKAILDFDSIATANKTFTFPNRSLTIDNITTSTTTNGTGFLKGNGSVISFDNSTYLTSLNGAVLTDQSTPQTIGLTGSRLAKLWATDITCTNAIAGSVTGNAGTVTNATLTTALTINGGSLTITANVANTSVLTIGEGAVSVSGTNTGDQVVPSTEAGASNNFLTAYNSTTGAFSKAQPTDANLSVTDVTTNNATTTAHGFAPKAVVPAANVLNVVGIANGETVYTNKSIFDSTNPAAIGTAAPGTSLVAAHRDHVHAGDHVNLANKGTNTHTDIDTALTRLADTSGTNTGDQTFATLVAGWDGWIAGTGTWSYSSVDGHTSVITVNADLTSVIGVGDRIKLTQTTAKYFIVTAISYSAPNTTITMYGGTDYTVANAAITSPNYSHMKSPLGFSVDTSKWTDSTNSVGTSQATPTANSWYNLGGSLAIPIGAWRLNYHGVGYGLKDSSTISSIYTSLSTANNSEGDLMWRAFNLVRGASGNSIIGLSYNITNTVVLASKTTYYANAMTSVASSGAVAMTDPDTGTSKVYIEAVCAYL